jgi:hypothetical protein
MAGLSKGKFGICSGCVAVGLIDLIVNGLGAPHPRFGADAANPIRKARNKPEVLAHMLFTNQSYRHDAAG